MNNKASRKIRSKNIITSLVVPALLVVFAVVLGVFCGFNQGINLRGGILVSVVAENYDLQSGEEYSEFVGEVNSVLSENKVSAVSYQLQKDNASFNDVLVVKIDYQNDDADDVVNAIQSGLVSKFYSGLTAEEIDLRNLVVVSTFGSSFDAWTLVYTALATLVALLLICVYVGFRSGLYTSVITLLGGIIANALAVSLLIITRVQTGLETVAIVPVVTILASMLSYVFVNKAKNILKNSDKFDRKSNYALADETTEMLLDKQVKVLGAFAAAVLLVGLININNPVIFFAIAVVEAIIASLYTSMFVIPAIFGLTFVRKIKKEKTKKVEKQEKLDEVEVLKETDLDNLTSN